VPEPLPNREASSGRLRTFSPAATTWFRVALLVGFLGVVAVAAAALQYYHSPYWNGVGLARDQPVLFSHRHHAGELRIDCRYCHVSVETSAFAGMPSTHTCLTCHSQLFIDTPMLRPVVTSAVENRPLPWRRVNSLPDHVYFDHSIHVSKGVGCTTCHGPVGSMALTAKGRPLTMRWCLDCHRDPAPHLRPPAEVFLPDWVPPPDQAERGRVLMTQLQVHPSTLTNCSTCHH
jgi:hypothetical protein